jgi:hypothetical protein
MPHNFLGVVEGKIGGGLQRAGTAFTERSEQKAERKKAELKLQKIEGTYHLPKTAVLQWLENRFPNYRKEINDTFYEVCSSSERYLNIC